MDVKDGARHAPGEAVAGRSGGEDVDARAAARAAGKGQGAGQPVLELEPCDVKRPCAEAGIEADTPGAFRALVRQNLVRLRGRWRENHSATRTPVYVERITERGLRTLAGSE